MPSMAQSPSSPAGLHQSRVPGGFETDEDLSIPPITRSPSDRHINESNDDSIYAQTNSTHVPETEDNTTLSDEGRSQIEGETSILSEQEMRRRLMDMDSSFMVRISPAANIAPSEDTAIYFPCEDRFSARGERFDRDDLEGPSQALDGDHDSNSISESMSSPTAAPAARILSRAKSSLSSDDHDNTENTSHNQENEKRGTDSEENDYTAPQMPADLSPQSGLSTPTKQSFSPSTEAADSGDVEEEDFATPRSRKRPKFVDKIASQRTSYSSYTTISADEGSEVTVGADYALQSGGAAPFNESTHSRPNMDLSRTTSLGSMASGVSTLNDGEDKILSVSSALNAHLGTLNEEASAPEHHSSQGDEDLAPQTPIGADRGLNTPTETVISQHVRDVLVPATVVREYRDRHRPPSPEKRNGAPTPSVHQHGKSLTLKEQSSTIDRLMKENWDLKLKISFLNDALNRRSDEGVKAIISENVELRTAKFQSMTEIRELKRSIRELDRKLREKSDQLAENFKKFKQAESIHVNEDQQDIDDRVTYLTERLMIYEVEIERMRHEISTREGERRRMAEVLKKAGERRGPESDIGAREEMDMWKDLLDAETARREQADDENRKLREEIWRLKSDSSSITTNNATNTHHTKIKQHTSSAFSYTDSSSGDYGRNRSTSAASSTLVEQLRHENAELRREVGAQTSMLTSRNREKERLYQEIEELKLGARRGDGTRSLAGDSIFERSVSRAQEHSASRITEIDRINQISDAEREVLETRNEQLRDQINELKLDNISCRRQIDVLLEEFTNLKAEHEKLEHLYDDDMSCVTEEIRMLERERDEANKYSEDLENEIQEIKSEAQDRINTLVEEVDQKNQDLERLENDVANQAEQSNALNKEVRSLHERIQRVGEDMRSKIKKIQDLEIEIEAINRENEILDKDYHEEKDKNARLTVQQESSQNEIAFLREEQDGDKIKIGDLEDHVNNLKSGLSSEKDRVKDLESRLAEERHQREVIGSKEKQEVQKIINGLNREASDAQEEARKLKQSLQSAEIEATTFKERLMELESNLREALGDSNGTRSTFLTSIAKLQKDLAATASELDATKNSLSERERLLKNRDALLESHGLESKKLSELLDRERQARRADKAQHEQWQRSHQHTSRTVSQKDTRITELETSRQAERKKVAQLEQQFKDQLAERNNLLLTLWNRISAMCGADWQHQNTLVNNHLPTVEVVASMLPSFSKTLLYAVKTVEGMLQGFKGRVRTIERDLWKEYQTLETNLESRIKRLDRLEATVQSQRVAGTFTAAPEIAKLRGENRLLKSEIAVLQNKEMHARTSSRPASGSVNGTNRGTTSPSTAPAQALPTLMRHHSSSAVEALERASLGVSPHNSSATAGLIGHSSTPIEPSQQRWIHRLRELERRLKAEREARLLDRSGARKRLEEGMAENERLKQELERERVRKGGTSSS